MSQDFYSDSVDVRVFIEGVHFPHAQSIQITDRPDQSRCNIVVPPSIKLRIEEWVGAKCHIYYANKRVKEKFDGHKNSHDPTDWPILYQGELTGENTQQNVQSKRTTLQFMGHSRHFDQTLLYHMDPDRDKSIRSKTKMYFLGNVSKEIESQQLPKKTIMWSELQKVIEKFGQDELGRNIAFGEMVLRIMRMATRHHPIFGMHNYQLRLDQRFAAYADPDLKTLFGLKSLQKLMSKRTQSLPSHTPLSKLINMITGMCKYNMNQLSQPQFRDSGYDSFLYNDMARTRSLNASWISKAARKLASSKKSGAVVSLSKYHEGLEDIRINNPDSYRRITVDEFRTKVIRMTKSGSLKPHEAFLNLVEQQKKLPSLDTDDPDDYTPPGHKVEKKEDEEEVQKFHQDQLEGQDYLNEFIVTPTMEFSHPPKCNVFAPSDVKSFGMQRNIMKEPTRLLGKAKFSTEKGAVNWYIAPQSQNFFDIQQHQLSGFSATHAKYERKLLGIEGDEEEEEEERPAIPDSALTGTDAVDELKKFLKSKGLNTKWAKQLARHDRAKTNGWRSDGHPAFVLPRRDSWDRIVPTMHLVEAIENLWGSAVMITSGYRVPLYNDEYIKNGEGGAENSQHKHFRAVDIKPIRGKTSDFLRLVEQVWRTYKYKKGGGGMGRYDGFAHLDTRGTPVGTPWDFRDNPEGESSLDQYTEQRLVDIALEGRLLPPQSNGDSRLLPSGRRNPRGDENYSNKADTRGRAFSINQMATPEEMRRGVVAQIYNLNAWWLHTLDDTENEERNAEKGGDDLPANPHEYEPNAGGDTKKEYDRLQRSDLSTSEVKRYIMSVVEAEFYRRRYRARNVPSISSGFNPYPVPGFPGCVMAPDRPIIGNVAMVTHQLSPQSGGGTSSVTMRSPRYWDEGEVWNWMGGWNEEDLQEMAGRAASGYDENPGLYRRFPHWHNRLTVPENSIEPPSSYSEILEDGKAAEDELGSSDLKSLDLESFDKRETRLDKFYQFMIGCDSVDYLSNHASPRYLYPDNLKKMFSDRDPVIGEDAYSVNPNTLALREYNVLIAETDEEGRFKEGTLAEKFWGNVSPSQAAEAKPRIEESIKYSERYGAKEREMMVEFLGNEAKDINGVMVYQGPTFSSKALQHSIVQYIQSLNDIGGGNP